MTERYGVCGKNNFIVCSQKSGRFTVVENRSTRCAREKGLKVVEKVDRESLRRESYRSLSQVVEVCRIVEVF